MKIVLCGYDGEKIFGGPSEWLKRIAKAFRAMGHEVTIITFSETTKEKSTLYHYFVADGFNTLFFTKRYWNKFNDHTEFRAQWFVDTITALKPAIFLANNVFEALCACPQIEHAGIKTFGILHSQDDRFQWIIDLFIEERVFGPTNMIYVSDLLFNLYANNKGGNYVIGCGTDYHPAQANFSNNPFKMVYAGKLTVIQKQILKHLEAFKLARDAFKDQIEFHIYGGGAEANQVKKFCIEHPGMYFHGLIDSSEIQQVFLDYQGFVLLSDFEGLPVALMEAMSVGLVSFCSDISSGIPELITHQEHGFIVKDRGADFVAAIGEVINNPEKWQRISSAAKEKIRLGYATESLAEKWIEVFKTAPLGKGRPDLKLPEVHPQLAPFVDKRKASFPKFLSGQVKRILKKGKLISK